MSYVPHRPRRRVGRRRALHGLGVDFIDASIAKADAASLTLCEQTRDAKTSALDAQTNRLASTWAATNGLYTVADLTRLRDQTMALLLSASRALDQAMSGASTDLIANLRAAQDWIYAKESASLKFTTAINDATARGIQKISAPDFKDWVIQSMNKASVGIGFAAFANCLKPGLLVAAITTFQTAWDGLVALAGKLVKFAEDVGELVLTVPKTATDILTYAKYGAAAAAAYWLYTHLKKW